MMNSWSRSWQLSTPIVTGSRRLSVRDFTVGRKFHCLTVELIKLLTTGVIGMMVMYCIRSQKLCYIARHHLLLQSIASDLRKHILLAILSTVQLLISLS
jgi:hypothetical protein